MMEEAPGIPALENVAVVVEQGVDQLTWLPDWTVSLLLFFGAVTIPVAIHEAVFRYFQRTVENRSLFLRSLVQRTQGPSLNAKHPFASPRRHHPAGSAEGRSRDARFSASACPSARRRRRRRELKGGRGMDFVIIRRHI